MSDDATGQIIPPDIRRMPDGRLVLVGGNHNVQTMFAADGAGADPAAVAVFLANHAARGGWCAERGIGYGQWVFPDPIVFAEGFPPGSVASVLERALPEAVRPAGIHYPLPLIAGHPDRQCMTDTHYSPIGGMHVAADVARILLGVDPTPTVDRLTAELSEPASHVGDLGVQCTPPIAEMRARQPHLPGIRSATNGVQAGNMGIIQLVDSPNALTERTLLIFGDSFFRSLLPELARYRRSIVFCRTPFFHEEMVAAIAPHDIVTGLAERYFATTRPDAERPHFLAYPLMLGRATNPDAAFPALWTRLVDGARLARP